MYIFGTHILFNLILNKFYIITTTLYCIYKASFEKVHFFLNGFRHIPYSCPINMTFYSICISFSFIPYGLELYT